MTGNYREDAMNLITHLEEYGFKVVYDETEVERHGIYLMVRNKKIGYDFAPCVTFASWRDVFYLLSGIWNLYYQVIENK